MPLKIVRADTTHRLWEECADRFLDQLGEHRGPGGFGAHLWITHRNLRDLLLERARERGVAGWLGLPFSFFSELPQRFQIRARPVGLLTRRRMLSRLAGRLGRQIMGRAPGRVDGVVRGHMLDGLFGELLPEGVAPGLLSQALTQLTGDEFAKRRNRWIVEVYRCYLEELERRQLYDDRAIHARIASRVEAGALSSAIGGASQLHVYGLYTPRHRARLFATLAAQTEIEVFLYEVGVEGVNEFDAFTDEVEFIAPQRPVVAPTVQPVPDAAREAGWVARQVKAILQAGTCLPHEVAVVARSGRHDTRRLYRALRRAGVPCTARIRTRLDEIAALKAVLLLFRGAASEWGYRPLRSLLAHPYFDTGVDLRAIDHIAHRQRIQGLESWHEKLRQLRSALHEDPSSIRGTGLVADRLDHDIAAFARLREVLGPLAGERSEADWLHLTLSLLKDGVMGLRERLCATVAEHWEVVRLDQRGMIQVERLLREWAQLDHSDEAMDAGRWHALLSRLLAGNELVLSTPMHKGVQVLEAHDAALVPFRHLFVVHANEGEFPCAPATPSVLGDEECERLQRVGIAVPTQEQMLRREQALWGAVTSQASDVRISYRTTDAGGTPLLPSIVVPDHAPSQELARTRAPRHDDIPVTEDQANCLAAQTFATAIRELPTPTQAPDRIVVAAANPGALRQAIVAAVAESLRPLAARPHEFDHPGLRPNPWNGEIRDPRVLEQLVRKFGPDHVWSASALEGYGGCPFVFLVQRVLRINDLQEADEETSALTFGGVAHKVLESFYRQMKDQLPVELTAAAEAEFDRMADEVFAEWEARDEWLGLPDLWASTREQIRDSVREYLRWELPYLHEHAEHPDLIEHQFGDKGARIILQGEDLSGRQVALRLRGRVDRVDRSGKRQTVHHILDYKTSFVPKAGGYEDGSTLQAALYLEALHQQGFEVRKGRYRAIKKPAKPQNGASIEFGSDKQIKALRFARSIPARVRAGLFEPVRSDGSGGWKPWDPGPEITRGRGVLAKGRSRFDG